MRNDKLKVYVADEERDERCCGSCANREHVERGFSTCKIDGHCISYLGCAFCWCRRWKRDRSFDEHAKR